MEISNFNPVLILTYSTSNLTRGQIEKLNLIGEREYIYTIPLDLHSGYSKEELMNKINKSKGEIIGIGGAITRCLQRVITECGTPLKVDVDLYYPNKSC